MNHLNDVIRHHSGRRAIQLVEATDALARRRVLLDPARHDDGGIVLQDHWAVYFEATGQFGRAVAHRQREAELVEELFRIGGEIGSIHHRYLGLVRQAEADDERRHAAGDTRPWVGGATA